MPKPLRSLAVLSAIITLLTGCIPFGSNAPQSRLPQDPRFAEFTYEADGELKIQERTDSFNERMPGLRATQGHVVAANFPEGWLLPSPDHHLWVTGVASVPPETIQMLANGEAAEITHFFPVSIQASTSTFPKTATFSLFPPIMRILCSKLIRTTLNRTGAHSKSQALRLPRTVTSSLSLAKESVAKRTPFPSWALSRSKEKPNRLPFADTGTTTRPREPTRPGHCFRVPQRRKTEKGKDTLS